MDKPLFSLASQSPRRRQLLTLLNIPFQTVTPAVDETALPDEDPVSYVQRIAAAKAHWCTAQSGWDGNGRALILAADTTVAFGRQILGKPEDAADAHRMLRLLRDRSHSVHTAITLLDVAGQRSVSSVHTAVVTMRNYTEPEMRSYVAGGDPLDKAGAYGIQDMVFRPVRSLDGCFLGVMGLSVCDLVLRMRELELAVTVDMTALHSAHQGYACPLWPAVVTAFSPD